MSLDRIRGLLEPRLATWAAGRSPALSIAWQNASFTPPDAMHLRSVIAPGATSSMDMAGEQRTYVGAHLISILCPAGKGTTPGYQALRELELLFPAALRLSK